MAYYYKNYKNYYKKKNYSTYSSNYSSSFLDSFWNAAIKRSHGELPEMVNSNHGRRVVGKIGKVPHLDGKLYRVKPQKNDFMRFAGGEIYPQREDLPAALHTAIYHDKYDNGETMRKYYEHALSMADDKSYKLLNKDDLAYALELDVKRRGQRALDDFYEYEKRLPHGSTGGGKWRGGKFGSNTQSD